MESLDWFTTKSQGPLILAHFWQQRAVLAEKELSVLKEQFERAEESSKRQRLSSDQANEAPPPPNMDTPLDVMGRPSLLELAAKEKEVQTLIEDVQKLQSTLDQLRESSARQLSNFEEELEVRGRHIQRLEAQLEAQKDYQEIRRELSILKSIEFPHLSSTVDDEEEEVRREDAANKKSDKLATSALGGGNKPLEVLLLERNKALQSENTALKVANSELQGKTGQLSTENVSLQSEVKSQRELIEQLESDVSSLQHLSTLNRGEAEGQANANDWVAEAVKDVNLLGRSSSVGMSPVSGGLHSDSETAVTLLPILQAQRERFRQRNQELEALNLDQQQQMAILHSEVERLRTDNVALYEKVRFLQSYSGQRATKNTGIGISSETEELYERQYEDRLDPFASFSRRERQRKLAQLGPFERITYSMGQMILSSRAARTAGVIYFSVLHLLVFLVLYRLAYTETCHRDMAADWAQKYDDHMLEAHGLRN